MSQAQPRQPWDPVDSRAKAHAIFAELLALCPDFAQTWAEEGSLWTGSDDPGDIRPCGVFSAFTQNISEKLQRGETADLQVVFDYAETKMLDPDEEISSSVAACFLENLVNIASHNRGLERKSFAPFLGPKSRWFCRAWDGYAEDDPDDPWREQPE